MTIIDLIAISPVLMVFLLCNYRIANIIFSDNRTRAKELGSIDLWTHRFDMLVYAVIMTAFETFVLFGFFHFLKR